MHLINKTFQIIDANQDYKNLLKRVGITPSSIRSSNFKLNNEILKISNSETVILSILLYALDQANLADKIKGDNFFKQLNRMGHEPCFELLNY